MKVTKQDIERIAKLARLDSTAGSFDKLAEDMQGIIEMVDKLESLDLGDISDIINTDKKNALRQAVTEPCIDREKILQNAPESEAGGISVPKVVE